MKEDKDTGLHCPDCAELLAVSKENNELLVCKAGHSFAVDELVSAQTRRIRSLLISTIDYIDEQGAVLSIIEEKMAEVEGISEQDKIKMQDAIVRNAMMAVALEKMIGTEKHSIDTEKPVKDDDLDLSGF